MLATSSCSLRLLYGLPSAFFNASGPGWPSVGAGPPCDGAADVDACGVAAPDAGLLPDAVGCDGPPTPATLVEGKFAKGGAVTAGAERIGLVANPEESVGREAGNASG